MSAPTRVRPYRQPDADEVELIERVAAARATAEAANARAATDTAEAADLLARAGWPLRDIAAALGLSYQRVHQILNP